MYLKGERAPGEYWASVNNCLFLIFIKSSSSILNYVSATLLHHNLKLYESVPRTGLTLFWVTTPLEHTPICGVGGWGKEFWTN